MRRHITLTGWRHTERGLLLTTPDGQRRLGPASLSAQLLSRVGRGAPQIDLRTVSLIALLTPILDSLVDLATGYVATIDDRMGEQALIGVDPDIIRRPRCSTFRRRH